MGTTESNIASELARRLKHIRANWSKNRANNLTNILTIKLSGIIDKTVCKFYKNVVTEDALNKFEDIVVFSFKNVANHSNISVNSEIKSCTMPYDGCGKEEELRELIGIIGTMLQSLVKYL